MKKVVLRKGKAKKGKSIKKMGDYFECYIAPNHSKLVSSFFTKDCRRVSLYGVACCLILDENGKLRMDYVIPQMGPALDLLKENSELTEISFENGKWSPVEITNIDVDEEKKK